jgi:hypothetical protein
VSLSNALGRIHTKEEAESVVSLFRPQLKSTPASDERFESGQEVPMSELGPAREGERRGGAMPDKTVVAVRCDDRRPSVH